MSVRNRSYLQTFSERERLELYLDRHQGLLDSRLIKSGFSPSFTMNWNHLEGMKIGVSQPNEDDLRSFLTIYRKFISESSPIFIYKIFKVCQLYLLSDQIKNNLIDARRSWGNQLKCGLMKLNINGRELSPEFLCDLWLNAEYFHDDYDKIRHLETLMPSALEYQLIRHNFLDHIWQTTKYILFVGNIIRFAFREGVFNSEM